MKKKIRTKIYYKINIGEWKEKNLHFLWFLFVKHNKFINWYDLILNEILQLNDI